MIKSTTDPSFSLYGTVSGLETNYAFEHIPLSGRHQIPIYCFPFDTLWDYTEGMTLLVILDAGQQKEYYLDRKITIRSGVCFGFRAMSEQSVIAGSKSILTAEARTAVLDIPETSPDKHPLHVFTLFHQINPDGFFFRGEQHPPLELVYVEKGTLLNYCDGQKFSLHTNEFFLLSPNQWHMQQTDSKVRFLTISFSWEGHDFSHLYNRVLSASADIARSFQSILEEYGQDLPERDEFLLAQIKLLLLQILRLPDKDNTPKKPLPASQQAHRILLDKAMQTVSERIYGKLTVSDLAAAVNVSTSQLSFVFKTYLGMPPAKYITHIRLEESKKLLSEKNLSIMKIADSLGYASVQHFSKQFHNWYGCAPSAYFKKASS